VVIIRYCFWRRGGERGRGVSPAAVVAQKSRAPNAAGDSPGATAPVRGRGKPKGSKRVSGRAAAMPVGVQLALAEALLSRGLASRGQSLAGHVSLIELRCVTWASLRHSASPASALVSLLQCCRGDGGTRVQGRWWTFGHSRVCPNVHHPLGRGARGPGWPGGRGGRGAGAGRAF
jgi:hypothetical protein